MRTDTTRVRRLAAVAVAAAGVGVMANRATTQPPAAPPAKAAEPTTIPPGTADYGARPVAYIYGNTPVTRADLAEFLIARGGHEKVELLVNKKIIEVEAARRKITVTPQEMEAALGDDLKGINVDKHAFVTVVLPKYGKTLFEWMEDVVRPRLILTKMCKDRVQVTDADLQVEYERHYGEKRDVRIIIWPPGDEKKTIFKLWDDIRKNDEEFIRVACKQANPSLAAVAGHIKPICRHLPGDEKIVESTAFALREGDVSQVLETRQGYMVMKLLKVIPADTAKNPVEAKKKLYAEVFEQKLTAEIPKQFAELLKVANPSVLLSGPPAAWQFNATNRTMVEDMKKQMNPDVTPAGGAGPKK